MTGLFSGTGLLEVFAAANDILLGAPNAGFGFFSSPEVAGFATSSTEPIEALALWPVAALVELAVGFLIVDPTLGRAGGLLNVVPAVVLAAAVGGAFTPDMVDGLGFAVELVMVRFGVVAAFDLGAVGLDSSVCCSMLSMGSSIVIRTEQNKCLGQEGER
jgi:hypothetical protein